ncbi:hypothetical protein CFP56_033176 [Quercus suber]|uniref:SnoaL-like domain-containing protein n=1 Tax=Quercus suber TaxID=58331 RepID=A0AAW0MC32_QUESU
MAMAAAINFSGQAPWPRTCSKAVTRLAHGTLPYKDTCYFKNNSRRIQKHGLSVKRKAESTLFRDHVPVIVMSSNSNSNYWLSNSNSHSGSSSPSETINKFYTSINSKDLDDLREIISEDCYFEECSFPRPFEGKKEVMQFLEELTESMGENVKFSFGHICEGDEYTAGVKWHLEWKKSQIPFTRGSSFFECSKGGDGIIIKKAQVVIESPIKPGSLVLTLLKTVTSLFDEFPKATELEEWLHITCQSSLLSRLDHVSNNDRATNGPRTGGRGGGLLKATIGSFFSFVTGPSSPELLFPRFFGVEVATVPDINKTSL